MPNYGTCLSSEVDRRPIPGRPPCEGQRWRPLEGHNPCKRPRDMAAYLAQFRAKPPADPMPSSRRP